MKSLGVMKVADLAPNFSPQWLMRKKSGASTARIPLRRHANISSIRSQLLGSSTMTITQEIVFHRSGCHGTFPCSSRGLRSGVVSGCCSGRRKLPRFGRDRGAAFARPAEGPGMPIHNCRSRTAPGEPELQLAGALTLAQPFRSAMRTILACDPVDATGELAGRILAGYGSCHRWP